MSHYFHPGFLRCRQLEKTSGAEDAAEAAAEEPAELTEEQKLAAEEEAARIAEAEAEAKVGRRGLWCVLDLGAG